MILNYKTKKILKCLRHLSIVICDNKREILSNLFLDLGSIILCLRCLYLNSILRLSQTVLENSLLVTLK